MALNGLTHCCSTATATTKGQFLVFSVNQQLANCQLTLTRGLSLDRRVVQRLSYVTEGLPTVSL